MATGDQLLELAAKHVGERYVYGAIAPKDNANWRGPWDCAEFASWLVYQVRQELYGCDNDSGNPALADAYAGYWMRDVRAKGKEISLAEAAATPGAAVLRHSAGLGHIVISDGNGGTVEAHSTRAGVIRGTLANRRWDAAVLVPGIEYSPRPIPDIPGPTVTIYRLNEPRMSDDTVLQIQAALKMNGLEPGDLDGIYGPITAAAVTAYQATRGLAVDGEVGPKTAHGLDITLPQA